MGPPTFGWQFLGDLGCWWRWKVHLGCNFQSSLNFQDHRVCAVKPVEGGKERIFVFCFDTCWRSSMEKKKQPGWKEILLQCSLLPAYHRHYHHHLQHHHPCPCFLLHHPCLLSPLSVLLLLRSHPPHLPFQPAPCYCRGWENYVNQHELRF